MRETVDYIVVGAGTAGCILAARLSQDPQVTVALLEFGGSDTNPVIWSKDANAIRRLWTPHADENWGYSTAKQSALDGREIPIARGKVLGGCSAINAMIYIRGNRRDFDGWHDMGNAGWSFRDVLPYFKRSETYHGPASPHHGRHGPVSVINCRDPSPVSYAFVEGAAEIDCKVKYNDFNGPSQEAGAGFYQSTRTPNGNRVTAASAFVTPHLERSNMHLLTRVRATRILVDKGRAVGVEYADRQNMVTIRARREIVLCCGVFETPKLMMLSGLGPAGQLARNGISVVRHLPGVGENLQDHLMLGVEYESRIALDAPELLAEGGLFTWTDVASKHGSPDLQYFFGPIQFMAPEYVANRSTFTFTPILTQPRSRGTVTLTSDDPTARARVDTKYLSTEKDIAALEYGIRYARELAHTNAFDAFRGREVTPGERIDSKTEIRDFIRRIATTVWHACGTCRMGMDRDAVVDDQLRVHGVEGLRIADASIMPNVVNGNPNAAVMMIAEKAADLIVHQNSDRRSAPPGPAE